MDLGKLVFYIIVIIFIIIVLHFERVDLYCVDLGQTTCGKGMGSAYIHGKITDEDTSDEILDKICISARYQYNTIVWRRSLVMSFIASFVALVILERKIPGPAHFIILAVIIYLALYMNNEFTKDNIAYYAINQIDEATVALR